MKKNMRRRNPVKKYMDKFQRAQIVGNKKKYKRKEKHPSQAFEEQTTGDNV
jgi:hypothetical protein